MRKLLEFLNRPSPRGNFFRNSINNVPFQILVCLLATGAVVVAAINEYATNEYLNVGYTPDQPVAFDHSFHAGPDSVLGLDCRYCHNFVDRSGHSNVPSTNTCWSCHSQVKSDSPALALIRRSVETGEAVRWVKVVGQQKSLNMSFCLDCHRNPEKFIRPVDKVTDLAWKAESPEAQAAQGTKFVHDWKVNPPQSCSGCHR